MDAKLATREYRLKQWAGIISDCRGSGMKVRDYLAEHDITRDQYYYWLRALRIAALQRQAQQPSHAFVEIGSSGDVPASSPEFIPQMTISVNGMVIGLNESTPSALLQRTLEAVSHVQ